MQSESLRDGSRCGAPAVRQCNRLWEDRRGIALNRERLRKDELASVGAIRRRLEPAAEERVHSNRDLRRPWLECLPGSRAKREGRLRDLACGRVACDLNGESAAVAGYGYALNDRRSLIQMGGDRGRRAWCDVLPRRVQTQ